MNVYNRFRLYHWLLAAFFVGAYLSGESAETLHVWFGYGLIALLCVRLLTALCTTNGFPRLLVSRRTTTDTKTCFGKGLTVVLLATLATCSALGWLMIDNVDFINSTISPGLSDAWKLSVLNADDLPGDPAETHEFLANLVLGLVIAHLVFLLLFARKPARMMLTARRRKNAHDDLIALRARAVHEETVDTRSFELVPAAAGQSLPSYGAGQYLLIQVTCGDQLLWRCYSLSSTPGLDDCLRITVKRVPGGRVSNWLHDEQLAGKIFQAKRPMGAFVCPSAARDILLLAAGSGITPVYSILRDRLENGTGHVRLIYLNQSPDSAIFSASLLALQQRHAQRFTLQNRFNDERGRIGREEMLGLLRQWSDEEVFICGKADFMDLVCECLQELGAPAHRIHSERFTGRDQFPTPSPEVTHRIQVELKGQSVDIDGHTGEVLLESLERAGLHPPTGCRSGLCGACRCRIETGYVRLRHNAALSDNEIALGWTLACQAEVCGNSVQVRF
ncbi:2Fe-2S iron-sulfur cluster-binding protein [Pseudomonas aeruginosa]|uniref:2Fe-2S iron-sulfur cluster-binding protein n=1 Tax=Pseudomonas aeruginosa TaxID=287 RepID=UPI000F541E59|nr:2Fe-2S iron-sulfur cluster-binding protein [Pseudomonas aeruginosa]RQD65919.1 ferredoxin:oxidoreductase FAD/NAD(P)-binding protein [Pseudomonas aeruginosa]